MVWLFWLLGALVLLFSASLSLYLVRYRWAVSGWKSIPCLLAAGTLLTFLVGILIIFLIWPPPFWYYLL